MLTTMFAFLLGGAVYSLGQVGYRKIKSNKQAKTEEEMKQQKEDLFFESFLLSVETDPKWSKQNTSSKHAICHVHTESGLCFALEETTTIIDMSSTTFPPMIYKWAIGGSVDMIHKFSKEEVEKLKTLMKMKEVEKLTGIGLT